MIRITTHDEQSITRLFLEGKLAGEAVTEVERCWNAVSATKGAVSVDLTGVSFIDSQGKRLLTKMFEKGTRLFSKGLMAKCFIEEIESHK
ncbi:MAG TPA: STAS domain-containing protein [Pyrinomonadaceae bacterium]|jgi:ABC-type transporter Mla MlaB component